MRGLGIDARWPRCLAFRSEAGKLGVLTVLALALAAGGSQAAAQAPGTDTSIDANRLWLPIGPGHFATLRSSDVAPHLRAFGGSFAAYQHRAVILRQEERGEFEAVQAQLDAHLILAVGLFERLQIGAALPLRLIQSGVGIAPLLGEVPDSRIDVVMLGDARVALDWQVLEPSADEERPLGLLVSATVLAPTGDEALFTTGGTWALAPLVSADYQLGRLLLAAEAGARIRTETRALGAARLGSTLVARGGVAWFPTDDPVSLSLEGGGELELASQPMAATETQHVYDLGVGLRWSPVDPGDYTLRGAFALGGGGFGAPVFRVMLGLEYGARATRPARRSTRGPIRTPARARR